MQKINFEKFQVNEETRQIVFSCATTNPYQRYDQQSEVYYNQILVVNESVVDLTRLNNSAPLLFNHDTDKLLGVVESAWIVEDRVFVKVRFSKNDAFADRIYKDIIDGLIKNVSIGYMVQQYEDKKQNGKNNRYITKWMIYETSIVSIPADDTCGIRKLDIQDKKEMTEQQTEIKEQIIAEEQQQIIEQKQQQTETTEDIQQKIDQVEKLKAQIEDLKNENEKMQRLLKGEEQNTEDIQQKIDQQQQLDDESIKEIEKIGADFNIPQQEIRTAIKNKLTVKEFKNNIKQKSFNIKSNKDKKTMDKKEFSRFLAERNFEKPFTFRDFSGFADANLVGTQTTPLVAALNKRLGVKGYRTINGLTTNLSIPVQSGKITVGEVGVNDATADSTPTFTNVELTPKKISGSVVIGKQMLANTNSDVEAFVIDSLLKEISYKIQAMMLEKVAEGANKEITYSSLNAITWADILAMEASLDEFVAEDTAFVMSPSARAALKATPKAEGTVCGFICENNQVNGYAVNVSGVVGNDNIYFGDWNGLVLATWGAGIEVMVDIYSQARNGAVVIVASALVDAAVVQKDAFACGKVQE